MKSKILNSLIILTSLFAYLEWGGNRHSFIFQVESEILTKLVTDTFAILHPFILIPLFGQLLALVTLFQKKPSKTLTYISIASIGLLLVFLFLIGLISFNYKILLSTIPFLVVSVLAIRHYRKI